MSLVLCTDTNQWCRNPFFQEAHFNTNKNDKIWPKKQTIQGMQIQKTFYFLVFNMSWSCNYFCFIFIKFIKYQKRLIWLLWIKELLFSKWVECLFHCSGSSYYIQYLVYTEHRMNRDESITVNVSNLFSLCL